MATFIGDELIALFGEDAARKLCKKFPNAKIPGKKFWIQRAKIQFLEDYSGRRYTNETSKMLAKRYDISIRTVYLWLNSIRHKKKQFNSKDQK